MDEAKTREDVIDPQLGNAGWVVGEGPQFTAWGEFPIEMPEDRHQYVDYCLMHQGRVLAVVEAKRTMRGAEQGREQARQYAHNVQAYCQPNASLPFIFFTNGHDIFFWDEEGGYPPRKVFGYPTPDDLQYMMWRKENLGLMADTEVDAARVEAGQHAE